MSEAIVSNLPPEIMSRMGGGYSSSPTNIAVDMFEQFMARVRPMLAEPTLSAKVRCELFWSLARSSRDLAAYDVWRSEFEQVARDVGLTGHRLIQEDGIDHVLSWAWWNRNPFR
jgi:hypothetical protein